MAAARWPGLLAVIVLLASHVLMVTPRRAMIRSGLGHPLAPRKLLGSVFLGFLFNQLLPTAAGGDVLRAWRARQLGVPPGIAIHSVVLDRASGILVVALATAAPAPVALAEVRGAFPWAASAIVLGGAFPASVALWALGRAGPASVPLIGGSVAGAGHAGR